MIKEYPQNITYHLLPSIELLRENSDEYKLIMQQDKSICEAYTHAYLILCSCNDIVNVFALCKSCAVETCAEKSVISNMKTMKLIYAQN